MAAIFQYNETRIRLVFKSKEDLRDYVFVANPAQLRTRLPTEAYTFMPTSQAFITSCIARIPIAQLIAKLGALFVSALPLALLSAGYARI
jgi:hypothetical protein